MPVELPSGDGEGSTIRIKLPPMIRDMMNRIEELEGEVSNHEEEVGIVQEEISSLHRAVGLWATNEYYGSKPHRYIRWKYVNELEGIVDIELSNKLEYKMDLEIDELSDAKMLAELGASQELILAFLKRKYKDEDDSEGSDAN